MQFYFTATVELRGVTIIVEADSQHEAQEKIDDADWVHIEYEAAEIIRVSERKATGHE